MEFIGDDSSSDEEENGEEQQQPPPQKSSSSKPIIIQQQKQPPLPHIKVKKDDVNMKMKLRLLKQYEKKDYNNVLSKWKDATTHDLGFTALEYPPKRKFL